MQLAIKAQHWPLVSQDRPGLHWWRAGGDGTGGGHWRGPAHQLRRVQRHFQWGLKYRSYQCCIVFCSPGWCNVCLKRVAMIAVNLLSCTVKYFGLFWANILCAGCQCQVILLSQRLMQCLTTWPQTDFQLWLATNWNSIPLIGQQEVLWQGVSHISGESYHHYKLCSCYPWLGSNQPWSVWILSPVCSYPPRLTKYQGDYWHHLY